MPQALKLSLVNFSYEKHTQTLAYKTASKIVIK